MELVGSLSYTLNMYETRLQTTNKHGRSERSRLEREARFCCVDLLSMYGLAGRLLDSYLRYCKPISQCVRPIRMGNLLLSSIQSSGTGIEAQSTSNRPT
jgi:hypothetical protein